MDWKGWGTVVGRVNEERPSNNEIRRRIVPFYERNENATSTWGEKGSAVRIRDVKREQKALHGPSR